MEILRNYAIPLALAAVAYRAAAGPMEHAARRQPEHQPALMRWRVVLQFVALCLVMAAIYLAGK